MTCCRVRSAFPADIGAHFFVRELWWMGADIGIAALKPRQPSFAAMAGIAGGMLCGLGQQWVIARQCLRQRVG